MNHPIPIRRLIAGIVQSLAATAATAALAAAPLVSTTLEPKQISLGESAQLTVTSSGNGMEQMTLPLVNGLEFRVVGQSRRIEIINGATLATTSVIVRITPQTTGIFTIPGLTPQSQPLVLRVNPDNGTGGGYGAGTANAPSRLAPSAGVTTNGIHLTADGSAYIKMNLPRREVYVGESIPVDIEVGMRAGFVSSLNGLPTLAGGEFTLNNLSHQPDRAEKLIDGKQFTVVTWHSVLAPVKPGTFTLSVDTPLTVRIRTRPPRESMIDDLLGDPFLQNFFGATVPKDITVSSPPTELTVLALPTEGRPANFTGAVGNFKVAGELSSTSAAAGDPLTLRLHVTGTGNFDRVDSPMLEHLDHWKTYPPKSTFTHGDTLGIKGEKTFEQPLIASTPGAQTLPGVAFSYFDPETRRYATLRSAPLEVTIAPSAADRSLAAPAASVASATAPAGGPTTGLRPDHATLTSTTATLQPVYLQPRFLALSVLALVLSGGWRGLRRASAADGLPLRRRRVSTSTARLLAQLQAAADRRDTVRFLALARGALQERLAADWQVPASALAAALEARSDADGADLREIFALADEAHYSGQAPNTDLGRWLDVVRRRLEASAT